MTKIRMLQELSDNSFLFEVSDARGSVIVQVDEGEDYIRGYVGSMTPYDFPGVFASHGVDIFTLKNEMMVEIDCPECGGSGSFAPINPAAGGDCGECHDGLIDFMMPSGDIFNLEAEGFAS